VMKYEDDTGARACSALSVPACLPALNRTAKFRMRTFMTVL
jgi:hypothetical protein